MAPPSRDQIEKMAFMAMMDGIIHTSVPCNCATCKSETRHRGGPRFPQPKRTGSDHAENTTATSNLESTGTCHHVHSGSESKSTPSTKKSTLTSSQSKPASTSNTNPGRTDKVNALLKADNVQAVFDVLNLTSTSTDEKDLATKIQNATKDCKLYQETKDKILELCDDEEVDLDAVFGLLAKFRYERNMLTTAVIKGNSEREKALLCIQRVDHLMYMLQDVAKQKDSKGNDVMHKLGDIIMEIHDLAKTPSTLYDEFLDIKEEHFDLLNDHEEMHQKFVDVNSCHEKLHSSHDKLQTEHNKLQKDYTELKKKAGAIGQLKNDISKLEKAVNKNNDENADLKKEVERLNAELAKVNALKHENAQLKKKVTTLSVVPSPPEESSHVTQTPAAKKKKGKKGPTEVSVIKPETTEPVIDVEARLIESGKIHEEQIKKLKKAHDIVTQELETVRVNLKRLDALVRKAETGKEQALEKLELEKATSRNWKDIAQGHSSERDRLQAEVERHHTRATRLQSKVDELAQTLSSTKTELAEHAEAHKQIKAELENRPPTPSTSITSQQTASLSSDTIRLLRKIRSETGQLTRELDDPPSFASDIYSLLDIVQSNVRRVACEVERDIEEILSVKGNDPLILTHGPIPEAVLPFTYNTVPNRHTPQFSPRLDYSSQDSPRGLSSNALPPYRPMMPPPGFSEAPANSFSHSHSRIMDSPSAPFSRIVEPPGLSAHLPFNRTVEPPLLAAPRYNPVATPSATSLHSHTSLHSNDTMPHPNVGVIGSRSSSSKFNNSPSPVATPAPSTGSASATATGTGNGAGAGAGAGVTNTIAPGATPGSGLGNGAVGVDWNMWARSTR